MANVFITGSSDGLGRAAANSLIEQGHQVVLHARSTERAEVLSDLVPRSGGVVVGDLSSAKETRNIAEQVDAIGTMDAVIHNAGVYAQPSRGSTAEGHATTLAVNTLAPYLLTALMKRPKRLVYLSSGLHRSGQGPLNDMDWAERRCDAARAYAESKLYVTALASAVARRWPEVVTSAVDPGWVRTKMGGANAPVDIDNGQRTQTWLAVSDDPAARMSGGYWRNLRREAAAPDATDVSFQRELLDKLAALSGVSM